MNVTVFNTESEPKVEAGDRTRWLTLRGDDARLDLFFNSVSELKAFSESLAKQVGELDG